LLHLILASAAGASEVTAVGLAPILDDKLAEARKAALEEAKRAAVEQALGSYVESRTRVNDFALASDVIYSSIKGRIDSYRVTGDERLPGDTYRVEIVATFEDEKLLAETQDMLRSHHWHKKPRLVISVDGRGDAASQQLARQLEQGLERKFRSQGFEVFDPSGGQPNRAGFLLQGEAWLSSNETEYQGLALNSTELSVSARLTRVGSGQVIGSATYNGSKPGANQSKSFASLSKQATGRLYEQISWQLNDEWLRHQARGSDILLQVSGREVTEKLPRLKQALGRSVRGLQSISTDSASRDSAVLSVVYLGWPEQLYEELSVLNKKASLGVSVDGIAGNTLQIRVL
jgi:hypothetical protein